MWLVRFPLKSQELFGDGSRQVGLQEVIFAAGMDARQVTD